MEVSYMTSISRERLQKILDAGKISAREAARICGWSDHAIRKILKSGPESRVRMTLGQRTLLITVVRERRPELRGDFGSIRI
jgi:hypothetical protein